MRGCSNSNEWILQIKQPAKHYLTTDHSHYLFYQSTRVLICSRNIVELSAWCAELYSFVQQINMTYCLENNKCYAFMHLLLCCQSWQLILFSTEIQYFLNFEYLGSRTRTIFLVRCSCKYPYVVTCSVQSSMSKQVPTMVF